MNRTPRDTTTADAEQHNTQLEEHLAAAGHTCNWYCVGGWHATPLLLTRSQSRKLDEVECALAYAYRKMGLAVRITLRIAGESAADTALFADAIADADVHSTHHTLPYLALVCAAATQQYPIHRIHP